MLFGRYQACIRKAGGLQLFEQSVVVALSSNHKSVSKSAYSTKASSIWPVSSHGPPKAWRKENPSRRNCLVTGGTSGIGYEVVKQLINHGANSVRLVSRDVERAEKAVEALKRDTGFPDLPVGIVEGDLSSVETIVADWTKFTTSIKEDQGQPIDTLVNCAGVSQNQLLQRTSSDEIAKILKVNLQAPIELSKAFLNTYQSLAMQRKNVSNTEDALPSFCVINISSLLADRSNGPGTSVYGASKAGLIAFTRSLAVEGAHMWSRYKNAFPPFRANVVVPGYIDTRMTSDFSNTHKSQLLNNIPLGRFGTPAEVAEAVIFLLRNEYANNCVLNLDGGLSAT